MPGCLHFDSFKRTGAKEIKERGKKLVVPGDQILEMLEKGSVQTVLPGGTDEKVCIKSLQGGEETWCVCAQDACQSCRLWAPSE